MPTQEGLGNDILGRLQQERNPNVSTDQGTNSVSPYFLAATPGGTAQTISNLSQQWSQTGARVSAYDAEAKARIDQQTAQKAAQAAAARADALSKKMQSGAIAADAANQKQLQALQKAAGKYYNGTTSIYPQNYTGATTGRGFDSQSASQLRIAKSYGYSLNQSNYTKSYTYDPTIDSARNKVLQNATSYLGTRYQLGGNSHSSIDCSGLVQAVYGQMGYKLDHSAADQGGTGGRGMGKAIPGQRVAWGSSALKPGDVIAWRDGSHIAIYAGNGEIIEAANTKVGTVKRKLWDNPANVVGIHLNM